MIMRVLLVNPWIADFAAFNFWIRPWVFVTEDYGDSWRQITDGLPDWSVNAVREHPRSENLPITVFMGSWVSALYWAVTK